jgi:hypothetical protein
VGGVRNRPSNIVCHSREEERISAAADPLVWMSLARLEHLFMWGSIFSIELAALMFSFLYYPDSLPVSYSWNLLYGIVSHVWDDFCYWAVCLLVVMLTMLPYVAGPRCLDASTAGTALSLPARCWLARCSLPRGLAGLLLTERPMLVRCSPSGRCWSAAHRAADAGPLLTQRPMLVRCSPSGRWIETRFRRRTLGKVYSILFKASASRRARRLAHEEDKRTKREFGARRPIERARGAHAGASELARPAIGRASCAHPC